MSGDLPTDRLHRYMKDTYHIKVCFVSYNNYKYVYVVLY